MSNPLALRNIFSNPGLKILGVLLAMLLWFHVATNKPYEIDIPYVLEYTSPPDSLLIAAKPPNTLTIRATGSGKQLIRTMLQDRIWSIDLAEASAGTLAVALSYNDVPTYGIDGLRIMDLSRDTLRIVIDSLSEKRVPIVSSSVWEVAPNHIRTGEEVWTPDSALLTGPQRTLGRISSVRSEALEIRNQGEPVDREVGLMPPDAFAVSMEPSVARMQQMIEPFERQEFSNLEIQVTTQSRRDSCLVIPATVSIEIGGPRSVVHGLQLDSITIACAVSPKDTTGQRRPVYVSVPAPLQVLSTVPDSVTVQRHDRTRTNTGS